MKEAKLLQDNSGFFYCQNFPVGQKRELRPPKEKSAGVKATGAFFILAFLMFMRICAAENLSENFKEKEFACRCCGVLKVDPMLMEKLELLRAEFGKPIIVTSGYRCPKHNKEVGGVSKSQHIQGKAADIKIKGINPHEVAEAAKKSGFTFILAYSTWTHVDVR